MQVRLGLHKYIWQWIVRDPDHDIQAERYLAVIRYGDGGDLNRRGLGWRSWGLFFLLSDDFFLGGTTLLNFLFTFLLNL